MTEDAKQPWLMEKNRVERFFIGGEGLDRWQRVTGRGDSTFSEELLVNTNPYLGPGSPPDEGYSRVAPDGRLLKAMIEAAPDDYLGQAYNQAAGGQCAVLVKGGDSTGRLILQYHPTTAFARQHLGCAFGKTEAWYMLGTRPSSPGYCYAGFKPGVTREGFEALFYKQDVEGMLACIHKVRFALGQVVLVPAGIIHAMGPGITFLEAHQPCDYTMRFERDNYGRPMADDDLHYGLGFKALFDGLDFTTYTDKEIHQRLVFSPQLKAEGPGWARYCLMDQVDCPEFGMDKLVVDGQGPVAATGGYRLLVALKGDAVVSGHALPQGRAMFLPAGCLPLMVEGQQAELLLITPFL